jgi:hypothetical protein
MSNVAYNVASSSTLPSNTEARQCMRRVVAAIVRGQGYDGIESSAMDYILNGVESCESCIHFTIPYRKLMTDFSSNSARFIATTCP